MTPARAELAQEGQSAETHRVIQYPLELLGFFARVCRADHTRPAVRDHDCREIQRI